jgi:hypothetical protein
MIKESAGSRNPFFQVKESNTGKMDGREFTNPDVDSRNPFFQVKESNHMKMMITQEVYFRSANSPCGGASKSREGRNPFFQVKESNKTSK